MRVAAIDLGTNSTRLLVANVHDGRVEEIDRRLTITGLGEGLPERGRLLPLPIARVRNCLSEYRRVVDRHGAERTLAVATSAVRDADNGEAFLGEVEWSYGFATHLLTGEEEARLMFRGVAAGRSREHETVVIDVGGGSTELVHASDGEVDWHASLDVGCVRQTELSILSDPPSHADLDACARGVRAVLGQVSGEVPTVRRALGVAGTVTTLAALDLGLEHYDSNAIHGHVVDRAAVERELERLAALPLAERRRVPGLEPRASAGDRRRHRDRPRDDAGARARRAGSKRARHPARRRPRRGGAAGAG